MASADADVLEYAVKIAKALNEIGNFNAGYGTFYVSNVEIQFDGEESGISIIPNDFNKFDVRIEGGA